jgi:nicotinamidase/pyrazinamidase
MANPQLAAADALLIVDVQNDFCPGGALPIAGGDLVVPVLNRWIGAARAASCPVIASRDWHPLHHPSFAGEGGPWPRHCVQDTPGAGFRADLAVPLDAIVVTKGTRFDKDQNSAFDETGLAVLLAKLGIARVFVGGPTTRPAPPRSKSCRPPGPHWFEPYPDCDTRRMISCSSWAKASEMCTG